jgi:hypothetical protein
MASSLPGFDEHFAPRPKATQTTTGGNNTTTTTGANTPTTQQKPPPVDPDAPAPGGFDLGPLHFGFTNRGTPGVSYPGSQAVHDFQNRATNAMSLNLGDPLSSAVGGQDLATLRAQREAVNQRMGTGAKIGADIVGQLNPTQLVNAYAPGVGPALQGATQEGVRGYAAGEPWPSIASDAAKGGAAGLISQGVSSPRALAQLGGSAVETGVPAAAGYLWGGDIEHTLAGGLIGSQVLRPVGDTIREWGKDATFSDATKQAIQNLILGGGATLTQAGRDNQVPPLPGFGYPGS